MLLLGLFLLQGSETHERFSSSFADSAVLVRGVLPEHNSRLPAVVGVVGSDGGIDVSRSHVGVGGVANGCRLAQHDLLQGDARSVYLVDGGPGSPSGRDVEDVLGVLIHVAALVVELDVVEVDHRADPIVDGEVGAVGVLRVSGGVGGEVGRLGGVRDDRVWAQLLPQQQREVSEPVLAAGVALLEGGGVLPVDVDTVELVVDHELRQLVRAVSHIVPRGGGVLSGAERAHNQLHAGGGVLGLEGGLDLLVSVSEDSGADVVERIGPDGGGIDGSSAVGPEGEGDVVEGERDAVEGVARDCESLCDGGGRPPGGEAVNVGEQDGGRQRGARFAGQRRALLEDLQGLGGCQQTQAKYSSEHILMKAIKSNQINTQHPSLPRVRLPSTILASRKPFSTVSGII